MPGRVTTLVKGTFCGKADSEIRSLVDSNNLPKLGEWLADYDNLDMPLEDIAEKWLVMDGSDDQRKHFREFFENGDGCFFPDIPEELKRSVVRGAFIQAMRLCIYESYGPKGPGPQREHAKTVVLYWIAGGPTFEAYVCDSQHEIHVMILTPDPTPALTPKEEFRVEPQWLVASPSYSQAIRSRAPEYPWKETPPEPMPEDIGVENQKVFSY